jgi:hypothetical protein
MAQVHGFFAIYIRHCCTVDLIRFVPREKEAGAAGALVHSGARECSEIRFHPSGKVIARDRMVAL